MSESRHPTVAEIAFVLEEWAPPGTAQSYDNVGLQIGRPTQTVRKAVIALDCTPAVVQQAKDWGADLVITHHPLLFRPLDTLTDAGLVSATALALAESRIALYAAHTNLDAARDGVSFALAHALGLEDIRFLQPLDEEVLQKLVVFVPVEDADRVRRAMADVGAGRIGAYEGCAFETRGTGHFRPTTYADPHIGTAGGGPEQVDEVRIEMEVASWRLPAVLEAMRDTHPYEEVAYDLIPVKQPYRDAGIGTIGTLPTPEVLSRFLSRVSDRLKTPALRYVGDELTRVRTVAVCGGSGSEFTRTAIRAGADAFVTADITYHRYFDALGTDGMPRIALVDAGHYETEVVTEGMLREYLFDRFRAVEWRVASAPTSPVRTFVR